MSIDDTEILESHVPRQCVRADKQVNTAKSVPLKSEEKCRTPPILCTFCASAINDAVRALFSPPICYKSFCKDAEHLHGLWKKWRVLESNPATNPDKTQFQPSRSPDRLGRVAFNDFKNEFNIESNANSPNGYDQSYGNKYHDGYKNGKVNGYDESGRKSRIGILEKINGFNPISLREKVNIEKKRFEGKEENSRGRVDGSRGQERLGKMIHDRSNKKMSPLWHRSGREIEREEMTPRGTGKRETEESRQAAKRGKKGDALDRLSGWAYRHGDEEKKFLKSREKRKDAGTRNENNVEMRDLPLGKKYRTGEDFS